MERVNEIRFSGWVSKDATLSKTKSGKSVVEFSIPLNTSTKKGDEWVDNEPLWFKVTAFGDLADKVADIRKGNQVCVVGRLAPDNYTKKDGTKVQGLQIFLNDIEVYEKKAPKEEILSGDEPF